MNLQQNLRLIAALGCFATLLAPALPAQDGGILGYWKEPGGSVIHVDNCGASVCATLVAISPSAPTHEDGMNPDVALRHRSLCGVRIGEGFHLKSPTSAEGGTLYDPKSGKTYHGNMERNGEDLSLRGYIGIALFGRTEKWSRTAPITDACRS